MSSLLEELRRRAKRTGDLPPFWDFKQNPEFAGRVVGVREDPRSDRDNPRHLWDVETLDGQRYTLPSYVVLERALAEQGAGEGKYIYVHFVGEGRKAGKGGRRPFLFEVAVMSQEEAEELLRKAPRKPKEERPRPKAEEPREERPKPGPEEPYSQAELDKGRSIIQTLFETGYAELEVEKLRRALEGQGVRVPLEVLAERMGLKIEGGRVRRP